jgi:hypothetical protein
VSEIGPRIDCEKERPSWWDTALTLGHLETRLYAAKSLDSPQEYRQALMLYAKRVADEGFRGKGEELVKELFGPTYWYDFFFRTSITALNLIAGGQGETIRGHLRSLGFPKETF